MSRSSSPDAHWDRLESWLSAITGTLLSEAAGGLQHLSREQLDDNLSALMSHDPTQDYSHKDLTKIIGPLAHNLLAQAKLGEASISRMEQEAAALKLQAEEAQRNLVLAQSQLDQLTSETQHQHRTADEKDPELQEEVERLQKALTDLRVDTTRREQWEKDTREELSEKLQRAEALLMRAETELKERDARARACEGHLQSSRAEVSALAQQRDYLKDELDTVHRELKYAYRLQSDSEREMHTTEFPLTSRLIPPSQGFPVRKGGESPLLKTSPASIPEPPAAARGWEPFQRLSSSHGVSPKELDKLARNIPTFTPNPAGGHDVHAYLKDIDFHLQTVANVTTRDRLYLLRITASREVRSFLDRQPETVEVDYQQMQQALIKEFSDPESEQGLITAMDLKQGRQETTQAYYNRLRQAYFGARNEPGMEQDFNFKILFLRNLHPTVSHHLGVLACPRTMSTQQLRDLAHKAYVKQKTASEKTGKNPTIYPVTNQSSELALEGAEPSHTDKPVNTMSRSFPTSREQHGHGGARPKHQYERPERSWDRSQPPLNRRGGATWEAKRRPKGNRHSQTQA
uniref:Retrotransposon gag domain-containing protein n=1 Tax=Sinocyclocheilus rhinocerous TaxID=307959 RepID=A0A673M5A6_9TELE